MIDIHTHILHGVDDGSPELKISIEHLKLMQEAGITDVFLTSHFLRPAFQNPVELITKRIAELRDAAKKENINIKLHRGAEIYLDDGIHNIIESEQLSLADTKYLLVETNMTEFPADLYHILYELVRAGYKPILAHPERYMNVMMKPSIVEDIIHKNVYMQINSSSLLGHYGNSIQKTAWRLLEQGHAHFLASDNHCRVPIYDHNLAVNLIRKNIDDFTADLLTKTNPVKILTGEKIEYFYVKSIQQEKKGFFSRFFK